MRRRANYKLNELERQLEISISLKHVKHVISTIIRWKSPDSDRVHGFWCKKLTQYHRRIAGELQEILESGTVPEEPMVVKTIYHKSC